MTNENYLALGSLFITLIGASWVLHNELSAIRVSVEKLIVKFEQVEKIEKRVDRLEKKVFHIDEAEIVFVPTTSTN